MADFFELKVSGIVQETADTRSFIFDVPVGLRGAFTYVSGQFLTFEIPFEGMIIRRCYSLASAPETDAWPKVTVKRVVGGRVSNWFNDELVVGSKIRVSNPEGRFVLHEGQGNRPLTLFGGGSGITPVISLLKTALVTTERDVKLVYANRDPASIIFRDELALLKERFGDRLTVVHHLDSIGGFLTVESVSAFLVGRESGDFYVCGPAPFMDTIEAAFEAIALPHEQRSFERFVSPLDPDRRPAEVEEAPAAGGVPTSFQMTLDGTTHKVPYRADLTLLEAAREIGVKPPSSCEDGYCSCCMAFLVSGNVHMRNNDALSPKDVEAGWVLTCQCRAAGPEPIVVDYDQQY